MNIPLISGQLAKMHIKLESENDFELYGGTTKAGFSITSERPESKNEWLVTINESEVAGKPLTRFDVYVRQISSGREWVVLSGKILVSPRSAGVEADKLAPIEYNVIIPVVENAVDLTGAAIVTGIPGPRGWSAYEIAVMEGFEGTAAEWLESMRQQTATLAVEQVTPLMERAETAAGDAEQSAANASQSLNGAKAFARGAEEEATRATAAANKVAQHEDTVRVLITDAEAHEQAAAKSAQAALANQQGAEQAAHDAALAQVGAEKAARNADAASQTATQKASEATVSASQAAADKAAAEKAKSDAQAALGKAEQEASKAEQAAADAQAPESIAAQAARPATMLLVRDELLSILGDASLFDLDTDGQKIIVHTDRLSDDQLAAVTDMLARFVPQFIEVVQFNHHIEVSWRDINKYAECKTIDDLKAVNPDYKKDVTSDGEWVYPLPKITWKASEAFMYAPIKKVINFELPGVEHGTNYFWGMCEMDILDVSLPNYAYNGTVSTIWMCYAKHMKIRVAKTSGLCWLFSRCKAVQTAEIYAPKATNLNNMAETDWGTDYVDKLHTLTLYAPLASSAKNALPYSILTASSAVGLLDGLPTWTDGAEHFITVGIHVDHQNDEDVLAAIAAAEAKGWTLTVKWNGTPTAQAATTYGLRKPPIYARVSEMERPDGTTKRVLDWGHYVTDPTGYTEFPNLESALEEWGLTEYVPELPEESLTETE